MSRTPRLTIEQTRQHIRQLPALADADDVDAWIQEAGDTVQNSAFSQLFDPACYREARNELPLVYRLDGQPVFGIIDRLVITADGIMLIDYKTHQVDDHRQLQTLALNYREQMRYYRAGVQQLWPGKEIKSGLLFTNSARIIWLDEDGLATQRQA